MKARQTHLDKVRSNNFVHSAIRIGITTVTLDIFDTFLLRNSKPEWLRFFETAKLHANFFREQGYNFSTECLFAARLTAHKIAYRTAPLVGKYRDASIHQIFRIFLNYIGLDAHDSTIHELIDLELSYEKKNLTINKMLLNIANKFHKGGVKIFFLSDMYFQKNHIEILIQHFIRQKFYKDIYVSSEFSATKLSGILFRIFFDREKIRPQSVLHLGDNVVSDIIRPKELGIYTIHTPRPRLQLFLRQIRHHNIRNRFRHLSP